MVDGIDPRLANRVGALALALADRMREAGDGAARQSGAASAAIVALHEFLGGSSVHRLCQVTGLTHSGAVRLTGRLAADGLVSRHPGKDRREVLLRLTPRGRRTARRILAARTTALREVLDRLSEVERSALAPIVDDLITAVTTQRLADRDQGRAPGGGWMCRLCDFDACGRRADECPAGIAATDAMARSADREGS